jgi:hypothetical protein
MLGGAALNRTVQSPGSNLSARVMPRSMEGPGTRRGFVRLGGGAGLPPLPALEHRAQRPQFFSELGPFHGRWYMLTLGTIVVGAPFVAIPAMVMLN